MAKILIAPDKFKGSLSAREVIAEVEFAFAGHGMTTLEMSDGGEGFAATMAKFTNSESKRFPQSINALGETIASNYFLKDDRALMEMAEASGLAQLGAKTRDPWRASTYGVGLLICEAVKNGAKEIMIGLGGSATTDGGCGMALALGWKFLDAHGKEIRELPTRLLDVVEIRPPDKPTVLSVTAACDVSNPLLGERGCVRTYGPQKGIDSKDFAAFEARLKHLVGLTQKPGLENHPGSGAAGGLGFGLMAFAGAGIRSGFDIIAETTDLRTKMREADLIITGEGRLDAQSFQGKVVGRIAEMAAEERRPVHVICGQQQAGIEYPLLASVTICSEDGSVPGDLLQAKSQLRQAAQRLANLLSLT
jgi:glycerate kinase